MSDLPIHQSLQRFIPQSDSVECGVEMRERVENSLEDQKKMTAFYIYRSDDFVNTG